MMKLVLSGKWEISTFEHDTISIIDFLNQSTIIIIVICSLQEINLVPL